MNTKHVSARISIPAATMAVAGIALAATLAVAQPTITSTVVSGDPAAPHAEFQLVVSIDGMDVEHSVEALVFKVGFDSRKVELVAAEYVADGFGGLMPPEIVKPVNGVDPSFSAPDDPSANAFRHVVAVDLAGTNTLTNGDLLLLTFQNMEWPSTPLGIELSNPVPLFSADPADAEAPLIVETIGSDPLELAEIFNPVFDNSQVFNLGAKDTDGDRIPDFAEAVTPLPGQTNLNIADSDGDGLTDAEEIELGTDPRLRDTDGDGLWDYFEILLGTDPWVPNVVVDADGDGLPSYVEDDDGNPIDLAAFGLLDPDDDNPDTDGDGFSDGYEAVVFGSAAAASDPAIRPTLGDVNNSGGPTPTDALITLRLFGGAITLDHPGIVNKQAFDVNRDGQINPTDALIMMRRFGGAPQTAILPVPLK